MLGWTQPHCAPFRSVLAHPRLMPYYHALVGESTQTLHFGTIREMCPSATQTFCPDVAQWPVSPNVTAGEGYRLDHLPLVRRAGLSVVALPCLGPALCSLCSIPPSDACENQVISQEHGAEGFSLHGGPLTPTGSFNPQLQ